jgi:hypothetical protein
MTKDEENPKETQKPESETSLLYCVVAVAVLQSRHE